MRRAADSPSLGAMTKAVIASGLVNQKQLDELKRWSAIDPEVVAEEPKPLEETVGLISEALQSEGYVLMRETDLEVIKQYAATAQMGSLHIDDGEGDVVTGIEVPFGKTPLGEYIIAYRGEGIKDLLVNGWTFLVDSQERVFFRDVRELFFGEQKVFMVCVPSTVEHVE